MDFGGGVEGVEGEGGLWWVLVGWWVGGGRWEWGGDACFTRGGTGWDGLCCAVHACVSLTRDKEAICGKDCTGCPPASWNPSSKSPNSASSSPSSKSSKSSPKPASPSSSPSASASYSSMAPASTGGESGGLRDGGLAALEVRDLVSDSCAEG